MEQRVPGTAVVRSKSRARSGKVCDCIRQSFQRRTDNGYIAHSTTAWRRQIEQYLPYFADPPARIEIGGTKGLDEMCDTLHTISDCIACKKNWSPRLPKLSPSCRTQHIFCWDW